MNSPAHSISETDLSAWEEVQIKEAMAENTSRVARERLSGQDIVKRKKLLEHLVEKRKRNFEYIKELHQGGKYFLNSVLMTGDDVHKLVSNKEINHRARMFYYLGISLSSILELTNGPNTVRALSQLMEEWEYTFDAAPPIQGVKYMMATSCNTAFPEFLPFEADGDQLRSSIFRFKDEIVHEYLILPHLPFVPDYVETMSSLCDMLINLYENLVHKDTYSNVVLFDAVVRLDTRIKHFVVSAVAKEFTSCCTKEINHDMSSLRALLHQNSPSVGA